MGVDKEWLRTDGKAGSVDLSILAGDETARIKSIALRTVSELWYSLSPLEETALQADGTISPVYLQFDPWARITGGPIEEAGLALKFIKKWATERRHFPRCGAVAITNAIIHEGEPLTINGHTTSPVDVAWVTEYVNDPSEAITSTYDRETGVWTSYTSFANF
ncbi:MAG: hypothetical protein JWM81_759 [Candidatus Saccharibacteria bacterium]|nr:hypothetical protein [Candidatus Saccharibacteria bacterium]